MRLTRSRTAAGATIAVVAHEQHWFDLSPLSAGTPAGVALGRAGRAFLRPGDVAEAETDGLGRQRQIVRAA